MHSSLTLLAAVLLAATAAQAQDWAKTRLDASPRHLEWVKIPQGKRLVESFVAYPEVKDKATAVVVIHEIFGMTDWVRSVADQLAAAGYIAIAPDLLSGMAPGGGGSAELGAGVGKAISALPPDQITADLNAVVDYVAKLPACNGQVVVAGFCWGGGQTFRFATNKPDLKAAFAFYGPGPTNADDLARIRCPVYGFYAGNDARVTLTVPQSVELMTKAGKTYDPVTYEGAGHGFMRAGETPLAADADQKARVAYEANKRARDAAWQRWLELLKKL
jgi:carboxymethylenebutenolidase